jgi:hypothetical protein
MLLLLMLLLMLQEAAHYAANGVGHCDRGLGCHLQHEHAEDDSC